MPVARYSACEIALRMMGTPVVAVRGVAPVAAIVLPAFAAGTCTSAIILVGEPLPCVIHDIII